MNTAERYLLSNDMGWIRNNESPGSDLFETIAESAGGIIKLTEENTTPHLPRLLNLLSENGYEPDNRINPKVGEETQTTAYTTYVTTGKSRSSHLESTIISLPEGILMALSCPLATKNWRSKIDERSCDACFEWYYIRTSSFTGRGANFTRR